MFSFLKGAWWDERTAPCRQVILTQGLKCSPLGKLLPRAPEKETSESLWDALPKGKSSLCSWKHMALPVTVMGWLQRDRAGVRGSIHGGKGDSPKRVAPRALQTTLLCFQRCVDSDTREIRGSVTTARMSSRRSLLLLVHSTPLQI